MNIVDHDIFDETNLNRQALSGLDTIGKSKSDEAERFVKNINPGVDVKSYGVKIDNKNVKEIISGSDVIIDALDNIEDRFLIENAARNLKIPMVHGALAGFEGQVMTIFPEDKGLKQLFEVNNITKKEERPESILGVPAIMPSMIASFQVMEAIKIILKRGDLIRNSILYIDIESVHIHKLKF